MDCLRARDCIGVRVNILKPRFADREKAREIGVWMNFIDIIGSSAFRETFDGCVVRCKGGKPRHEVEVGVRAAVGVRDQLLALDEIVQLDQSAAVCFEYCLCRTRVPSRHPTVLDVTCASAFQHHHHLVARSS